MLPLWAVSLLWGCGGGWEQPQGEVPPGFRNLHDSVGMVGMQVCRSCHADVYESYIKTGMGRSFAPAVRERSSAEFGAHAAAVYDRKNDLYYRPFLQNDSLYIQEFRLWGRDTIHSRTEKIDFIIGSGHHTNSHLFWRNGYLHQAPITFYVQERRWDLAPGFEEYNERFGRWIASECLTCHNHYPKPVAGSENRYADIPLGIECERCHGAGGLHVREKLAGKLVDTAKGIDYSIVNPRHLPIELQMDLCQRCHLQGVAVLQPGRSFYDFKPGMALSSVFDVYLPRFADSHERFIMASQADRLRLSACYLQSGQLSCISCHNPHQDVHAKDKNRYNSSCTGCHHKGGSSKLAECSLPAAERAPYGDDCVRCHLPRSGSIDIPHVTISDHNISKSTALRRPDERGKPISPQERQAVARFLGLENLTNPRAGDLDYARGYLALYDKFVAEPYVLDSAGLRLRRVPDTEPGKRAVELHYWFARQAYPELLSAAARLPAKTPDEAWTEYRLGEAHYKLQQWQAAARHFRTAAEAMPEHLDFREKWGLALARCGDLEAAKTQLQAVLEAYPQRPLALTNLGFIYAQQNLQPIALQYYERALAADPDYEQALLNSAALLLRGGKAEQARERLRRLLQRQPQHAQALELWKLLGG